MKPKQIILLTVLALCTLRSTFSKAEAQGTMFTYQGQLQNDGSPANGAYDFRFRLASDPQANNYVGSSFLTNGIPVSNGLFTTTLDFGAGIFTGSNYWLEVDVRTNGASVYTVLNPLQALTPAPYAIFAQGASAAGLSGTIPMASLSGTFGDAFNLSNPTNSFNGIYTGNGGGLSNVNATFLGGFGANQFWTTTGNSNTLAGVNFLGTADNQPLDFKVNNVLALQLAPTTNCANFLGGDSHNFVAPGVFGATIGGGGTLGYSGGSGLTNKILANFATIGGGVGNTASGSGNEPGGDSATVAGGWSNSALGNNATVAGGADNSALGDNTVIAGGANNTIQTNSPGATIGGGQYNSIQPNCYTATTISGGYANSTGSPYTTIGGGAYQTIGTNSNSGTISGGYDNAIKNNTVDAAIGGGSYHVIGTNSDYAAIAGGRINSIGDNASSSAIAGGIQNAIQSFATNASIGGGGMNSIGEGATSSTIAGGIQNAIQSFATNASIGGGGMNSIGDGATSSTIAGGIQNAIQSFANDASIGGGSSNVVDFSAAESVIAGGSQNSVSAELGTVGGGFSNTVSGSGGAIPGGSYNIAAGFDSFAAGTAANAAGDRSFVWNSFPNPNYAVGTNEFFVFAENGFSVDYNSQVSSGGGDRWVYIGKGGGGFFGSVPATISTWTTAYLSDGGAWTSASDRARKENFADVDARSVLEKVVGLPVQTWNYTNEPPTMRHLGPVSQDFQAAFGLNGEDDKHITDVDEGGVALAAIQGLNQKLNEKDQEIQKLKTKAAKVDSLEKRLADLELAVQLLAERK